jgi:hypothetical protein
LLRQKRRTKVRCYNADLNGARLKAAAARSTSGETIPGDQRFTSHVSLHRSNCALRRALCACG